MSCRFITVEELEQALQEQKLYDPSEFKEVISEAESDNVSMEHHRSVLLLGKRHTDREQLMIHVSERN